MATGGHWQHLYISITFNIYGQYLCTANILGCGSFNDVKNTKKVLIMNKVYSERNKNDYPS